MSSLINASYLLLILLLLLLLLLCDIPSWLKIDRVGVGRVCAAMHLRCGFSFVPRFWSWILQWIHDSSPTLCLGSGCSPYLSHILTLSPDGVTGTASNLMCQTVIPPVTSYPFQSSTQITLEPKGRRYFSILSSRSLIICTFRPSINLKLIFDCAVEGRDYFFNKYGYRTNPAPFRGKKHFFSNCSAI